MATVPSEPTRHGWGPRPAPALHDAVTHLSKARAGILDLLSAQEGPVTVAQLARLSGQHYNTVREHLQGLAAAGLAQTRTRPAQGRGRPALLYTAVAVERSRPQVREYARLASAMAAHIAGTSADPMEEARRLGLRWGAELSAEAGMGEAMTTAEAAREIVGMLAALGYGPERIDGRVTLRLCPVLDVARRHPEVVCQVHLGVVHGMYAATTGTIPEGVALEPFAEPTGCRLTFPGCGPTDTFSTSFRAK